MHSIGNDIVDLNLIDKARAQSKPFYTKILSEAEQQLYQTHFNTIPFWQYVWLQWSCKEAVYKFLKRHQPQLVFSPVKICLSEPEFSEFKNEKNLKVNDKFCRFIHSINSGSESIFCNSIITEDYIHTIAIGDTDFTDIFSDIKRIDNTDYEQQSAGVRQLISEKLVELFPDIAITFDKADAGFPIILHHGTNTGIIASFAHHGNYVAYAFKRA